MGYNLEIACEDEIMNRAPLITLTLSLIAVALLAAPGQTQIGYIWETLSPCNAYLGSANMDGDPNEELVYYTTNPDQIIIYDGLTGLPDFNSGLWEYIGIAGWSSSSSSGSDGWLGNSPFCDIDSDGIMEITFRGQQVFGGPIKLYVVGMGGSGIIAGGDKAAPSSPALSQNYPNPFNPSTAIQYSITSPGNVTIKIYNTLGQEIRTVVDDFKPTGDHTAFWDGRDQSGNAVASGTYFYRLQAGDYVSAQKAILLK
jgi:hypothetical protein